MGDYADLSCLWLTQTFNGRRVAQIWHTLWLRHFAPFKRVRRA